MLDFSQKLYDELLLKIEAPDQNHGLQKMAPDQRMLLLTQAIDQIKQKLKGYSFDKEGHEIYFFKHILPLFLSQFIYYSEKGAIECSQRVGTEKSKREFLDLEFQKIDYFFNMNIEFFNYYRFGKTIFDGYYFLRSSSSNNENTDLPAFMMDGSFCTIYSWKLATIIAYSRLEREIRFNWADNEDDSAPAKKNEEATRDPNSGKLEWTDSKRGLTELVYSLQEQGSFNNGKADLKTIIDCFETAFSVDLGNTSSTYQQLLSRKKGSSSYLAKLQEKFEQRLDKMDEQQFRAR
jgi:hypothetical protein